MDHDFMMKRTDTYCIAHAPQRIPGVSEGQRGAFRAARRLRQQFLKSGLGVEKAELVQAARQSHAELVLSMCSGLEGRS